MSCHWMKFSLFSDTSNNYLFWCWNHGCRLHLCSLSLFTHGTMHMLYMLKISKAKEGQKNKKSLFICMCYLGEEQQVSPMLSQRRGVLWCFKCYNFQRNYRMFFNHDLPRVLIYVVVIHKCHSKSSLVFSHNLLSKMTWIKRIACIQINNHSC